MKRFFVSVGLLLAAASLVSGQAAAQTATKGPLLDKIIFEGRTQEDIGLADVAAGRSDLWNSPVNGAAVRALPDAVREKLDLYGSTGMNCLSLLLNPCPNAAPYTVTGRDGTTVFNPFALREIRFALNFLVNRGRIVDEIMFGAGVPLYTPVAPGLPNSSRFGLIASKLGFTYEGNEKKALADIDAAMQAAAALPQNRGRLLRSGQWWTYNSNPVTVKFLMRADDSTLRLPLGRLIADQIEKAGFKVERLEYDLARCRSIWAQSDPMDYGWSLYTEGWVGGPTRAWWGSLVAQMYAPWFSNMPGMGNAGFWNYQNAECDTRARDVTRGRVKDTADYYDKLLAAAGIGINEGVRVFIAAQADFSAACAARFRSRMIYGLGDGLDTWSLLSADVKPQKDGTRTLKMSFFSKADTPFSSAWDPIGPGGFEDHNSAVMSRACSDQELEANPVTGIMMPLRAAWSGMSTKTDLAEDGTMAGRIDVPPNAVLWNAQDQRWESGFIYADLEGDDSSFGYRKSGSITAFSQASFAFTFGTWHHGRPVNANDYRYSLALPYDIACSKGPDDRVHDEEYAAAVNSRLARTRGVVFNRDATITVYGDAAFPADKAELAGLLCPSLMVSASGRGAIVPWEILEAIKAIVAEGSESGTVYSYNSNPDFTEVDIRNQACVADIRAKLQEFAARGRVPVALRGFITPAQAVKNYRLAIGFIDRHGHCLIGNGAFVLDRYDVLKNTGVLLANRDPAYPYAKGYFVKTLATSFARVDAVTVPIFRQGMDLMVDVTVSQVAFPAATARPAPRANVKITLMGDTETSYTATLVKSGSFAAVIPARDLAGLAPGSYTLIVEAALGGEAGAVDTATLTVF